MKISTAIEIYIRNNWSIFPVKYKEKIPAVKNGVKDATNNIEQANKWFNIGHKYNIAISDNSQRTPMYNIGVACGAASGISVLDIDGNVGKKSLQLLEREFGALPTTFTVTTPSGGIHFYFKHIEGLKNRVGILPGIDFRASGGYVVAPPSVGSNGKVYELIANVTPAELPQWLQLAVTDTNDSDKRLIDSDGYVVKGSRNDYLFKFGCKFWAYGLSEDALLGALTGENEARCLPPIGNVELNTICKSIVNRYPQGNRDFQINGPTSHANGVANDTGYLGQSDSLTGQYTANEGHSGSALNPENHVDGLCSNVNAEHAGVTQAERSVTQAETQAEQCLNLLNIPAHKLVPAMCEYLQDKERVKGQSFYMPTLDKLMGGGMRGGEITVWHALAKAGKNTVWHKLMYLQAINKIALGYGSRELTPESEVLPNLLSIHHQENIWLSENIYPERFQEAVNNWPIHFCRGYGYLQPAKLKAWIIALKKQGVKQFWFDHLHYMLEMPEDHKEASILIKLLKTLAKTEDVHINIIVQANKLYEGQMLSLNSIKGGSAIGQALDNLIILERVNLDEQYGGDHNFSEPRRNIMRVKLEVGRSKLCKLGQFYLQYDSDTTDMKETKLNEQQMQQANCSQYQGAQITQDALQNIANALLNGRQTCQV